MQIRRAGERGVTRSDWLESYHTFSFGAYVDPLHATFRALQVLNEDRVRPSRGFGAHAHRDMEILTYVLEGWVEHRDSLGNGSVIRAGELQRMSAGTGVTHSEFNASAHEDAHFLQIWILPERKGVQPSYEQRAVRPEEKAGRLLRVACRRPEAGELRIQRDVQVYLAALSGGDEVGYDLRRRRGAWVQVVRGSVRVNGQRLDEGDGAALSDEARLAIQADGPAELMLFDLP